jgi:hypothetical protein
MKICIFYGARNQLDGHRLCPQWGGLRLNLERLGPKALWFIKSAWSFKFETYQYIVNSYRIDPLNLHTWTIFGLMIRKYFSDGLKPPIRVCLKWHFRFNGESDDKPTECSTLFSEPYYHLLCIHSQYKNKIWKYDHIYIYIYNLQMCCRLRFVSPSHRQSGAGEYKKSEDTKWNQMHCLWMSLYTDPEAWLALTCSMWLRRLLRAWSKTSMDPFSCLRAAAVRERTGLGTRWKITAFLGIAVFQASCSFFRLRKSWKSHDFLHPSSFQMQNPLVSTKYQSKWSINPHNTPN